MKLNIDKDKTGINKEGGLTLDINSVYAQKPKFSNLLKNK